MIKPLLVQLFKGGQKVNIEFAPELPEVEKIVEPFFKIPNWLIDDGLLCMLTGNSLLLYMLLVRSSYNGKGYIYTDQIVRYTNIQKTNISRYLKQLITLRLITITKQSKRYKYKRYNINTKDYILEGHYKGIKTRQNTARQDTNSIMA
jgi:hypothetical protein